ncbi:DUF3823 domain-containing protein [Paraflavitalea sp. CAU 1676]|uniref:DUF3823 domain-containing protein n=1 Tax=Paraflavitalea sp. CAU 1676 TaxID=3032598 RepID=UPI0023DB9623|nr:DUF3823 domain-containing protein [Paraflavitalea sp. CAU 1676]MDF2191839.1 DUF3823 domain-containing protein [Paraflavitalea sp. CAU 1676]
MKRSINFIFILTLLVVFASCKKDNRDAPDSTFKGRITYQGQPIMVDQGQVRFQLWEPGWGTLAPIDVAVSQEGTFSAILFNGNYKLVLPKNDGPYLAKVDGGAAKDTIMVNISGNKEMDIEVLPYYMVRSAQFAQASGRVNATAKIEKIITDANAKNIEKVSLFINRTPFVGANGNLQIQRKDSAVVAGTDLNNLQLSVPIPTITPAQNFVYARVGVKILNVDDWVYSPIQKITY